MSQQPRFGAEPIHTSIIRLVMNVLATVFLVETAYGIVILGYIALRSDVEYDFAAILSLLGLQGLKFFALAYLIGQILIQDLSLTLIISGHYLIKTSGYIVEHEKIYDLGQLRSISVDQGWSGKIMHSGTLKLIFGARGYTETLSITGVHEPKHYENILEGYLNENQALSAATDYQLPHGDQ